MLKFFCITLFIATASAALPAAFLPRGVVSPITICGGVGAPVQLRVTDCTLPPCEFEPDKEYLLDIDFIPLNSCSMLGFKLFILHNGEIFSVFDTPIPGSAVIGGMMYNLRYPLTPEAGLKGNTFDLILQIYCVATEITEICVGAPATIV